MGLLRVWMKAQIVNGFSDYKQLLILLVNNEDWNSVEIFLCHYFANILLFKVKIAHILVGH